MNVLTGGGGSELAIGMRGTYPLEESWVASLTRGSKQRKKINSEIVSPWNTPLLMVNVSVTQLGVDTNMLSFEYRSCRYQTMAVGSWMRLSMSRICW